MPTMPASVAAFLSGKRFAVAGVSRQSGQAANAVYQKLIKSGYQVFPVNPNAQLVEGAACYPNLASVPGNLDGVVIATHPAKARDIVRQCADKGVKRVWFHRSFGEGSVAEDAIAECKARGIECIVGGCPLMYCAPVDFGHACMRFLLRANGRVPG